MRDTIEIPTVGVVYSMALSNTSSKLPRPYMVSRCFPDQAQRYRKSKIILEKDKHTGEAS